MKECIYKNGKALKYVTVLYTYKDNLFGERLFIGHETFTIDINGDIDTAKKEIQKSAPFMHDIEIHLFKMGLFTCDNDFYMSIVNYVENYNNKIN